MHACGALALLGVLLLAGCSTPALTGDAGGTGATAPESAPVGWSQHPCDAAEPRFSPAIDPRDMYRRAGDTSARVFADHVAEAVGDAVTGDGVPSGMAGRNDPHAFQTRDGVLEVYWETDPAAWSAEYQATARGDAPGRNQTAHAILGSLQSPVDGITWREEATRLEAVRTAGGTGLLLVRIEDQTVEAEQATILRRQVRTAPDYEIPSGLTGLPAVAEKADEVLACSNAKGGPELSASPEVPLLRVDRGILAYWVLVEPHQGWGDACPGEKAGQLHVALDAQTGTVVSADLACR